MSQASRARKQGWNIARCPAWLTHLELSAPFLEGLKMDGAGKLKPWAFDIKAFDIKAVDIRSGETQAGDEWGEAAT